MCHSVFSLFFLYLRSTEVLAKTVSMVIVRHPFSRLVSAYYNKLVHFTPVWDTYRKRALSLRPGGNLIIEAEGKEKLKEKLYDEFDPHLPM